MTAKKATSLVVFRPSYALSDVSDIGALGGKYGGPALPEGARTMAGVLPWPGPA